MNEYGKGFIVINESFTCANCGKIVPKAKKTCRNHCIFCLYSRHVDVTPGDRKEICQGLMEPVKYEMDHGQIILTHKCTKCGVLRKNKAAPDDDVDKILSLVG